MPTKAKIHDKEGEAFEIGKAVCYAKILATQYRPDLDAVLALWICQRIRRRASIQPAPITFIKASTTSVEHGVLAIDVGMGKGLHRFGKGRSLKRSSIRGSASLAVFRALPEDDRNLLRDLVQAVSDAEEKGDNVHIHNLQESLYPDGTKRWDNSGLRSQILMTTMWSIFDSLCASTPSDAAIVEIWGKVFDGVLAAGLKRREALQASDNAELRYGGFLAILPHNAPQQTSKAVYAKGTKVVVFSSFLGGSGTWTLGISRRSDEEARAVDLHEGQAILKKYLPDIFVHPGGYMAGWTIRSPLNASADEFRAKREALILAAEELVGNALQNKG